MINPSTQTRVLYVAHRHDPADRDAGSGIDHFFHWALSRDPETEVRVLGPSSLDAWAPERALRRAYRAVSSGQYAKYPLTTVFRTSRQVDGEVRRWQPNVVFTPYPALLTFCTFRNPSVVRLDTTFRGQEAYWPTYGPIALALSTWQERLVFRRTSRIVTASDWSRGVLESEYGVPGSKIMVLTNPSMIPPALVADGAQIQRDKVLGTILNLLFVGRNAERKGLDVAVATARVLNARGLRTQLTVVGMEGEGSSTVKYKGLLRKSDPDELVRYVRFFQEAHFLIHPARFEAAGIVPSEAAAFGTPTITNGSGGLATTVKDGDSGVVLEFGSGPEDYADAVEALVRYPKSYFELCARTRSRFEDELNWDVASKRLTAWVRQVAQQSAGSTEGSGP